MRSILLLFIMPALLLWSCKTSQDTSDLSQLTKVIEMKKSPCFGQCPTFSLTIYQNGFAAFDGQANTDKQGLYVRQLSKAVYQELFKTFKEANLRQYQDHYPSDVQDLPKVTISYFDKAGKKSIVGDMNRPEAIVELEKQLDAIAKGEGWIQREVPKQESANISNELIVQLQPRVVATDWIRGIEKYGAILVKELGPKTNRWLVQYDTQTIRSEKMLALIKSLEGVENAEFNKKLKLRNR